MVATGVLAALAVWLGFSGGGFFAGTVGLVAALLAIGLAIWVTVAPRPFAALTRSLAAASGALALLAVWALVSASWSGAPAAALLEFDRSLLYALLVLLAGLTLSGPGGRVTVVRAFALASVAICVAGLASRVLPETFPTDVAIEAERLSVPLTYWNAMGLMAVFGVVLCLHLAAWEREPRLVRAAAAAAVPVLVVTLYFTFSRGPMAVLPIGALAYLVLARPRGAPGALLAIVPTSVVAIVVAYGAEELSSDRPTSAEAVAEGRGVALAVLACAAVAGLVRALTPAVDARLAGRARAVRAPRRTLAAVGAVLLLAVAGAGVASGAPGWASRQYERFVDGNAIDPSGDQRARLVNVGNNGRLDHWRVSVDAFEEAPLRGTGAGTYERRWARERPTRLAVVDGHSLYVETLGELGLVGLVLVVAFVLMLLAAALRLARGPDRALGAVAFAVVLAWAVHAGIDWDWELAAITAPVLALGAAMLGGGRRRVPEVVAAPPRLARLVVGLGCLLLAVTPAAIAISQHRLDGALRAFRAVDCVTAIDRALSASRVLRVRPEPFEIIGLCDARLGEPRLAVAAIEAALRRDDGVWQHHYELALVRAVAGRDPRAAARRALELNPRSDIARELVASLRTSDPADWRRAASRARLPF